HGGSVGASEQRIVGRVRRRRERRRRGGTTPAARGPRRRGVELLTRGGTARDSADHAALPGQPPGAYGAVEATAGRPPATRSRSARGCCTDCAGHAKARPPAADVSRDETGG